MDLRIHVPGIVDLHHLILSDAGGKHETAHNNHTGSPPEVESVINFTNGFDYERPHKELVTLDNGLEPKTNTFHAAEVCANAAHVLDREGLMP